MTTAPVGVFGARPKRRPVGAVLGAAVEPSLVIGVLVQATALGTCVGTLIAYRRRQADPRFDTFSVITRWSAAGFAAGLGYVLIRAIL